MNSVHWTGHASLISILFQSVFCFINNGEYFCPEAHLLMFLGPIWRSLGSLSPEPQPRSRLRRCLVINVHYYLFHAVFHLNVLPQSKSARNWNIFMFICVAEGQQQQQQKWTAITSLPPKPTVYLFVFFVVAQKLMMLECVYYVYCRLDWRKNIFEMFYSFFAMYRNKKWRSNRYGNEEIYCFTKRNSSIDLRLRFVCVCTMLFPFVLAICDWISIS